MLKNIIATVAIFTLFIVGLEMTVGPVGGFSWPPISAVTVLCDISPVVNLFPAFLWIPFLLLLTTGLLSLMATD